VSAVPVEHVPYCTHPDPTSNAPPPGLCCVLLCAVCTVYCTTAIILLSVAICKLLGPYCATVECSAVRYARVASGPFPAPAVRPACGVHVGRSPCILHRPLAEESRTVRQTSHCRLSRSIIERLFKKSLRRFVFPSSQPTGRNGRWKMRCADYYT
jgi:hypothetical protein